MHLTCHLAVVLSNCKEISVLVNLKKTDLTYGTSSMSEATIPTMTDVVVLELWTATVKRTPSMTPTTGFWSNSDWEKTRPVLRPPRRRKEEANRSREQMNTYKNIRTRISFRKI